MCALKKYELPPLPYDYSALEPAISEEIMRLHHTKHHNAYVTNLNAALEKYLEAESKGDVSQMIALQAAIRFNGGGHINHSIFWTNLAPQKAGGGKFPTGPLAEAVKKEFGSFEVLMEKMSFLATSLQGSGWVWLGFNKNLKRLVLASCSNQDPLVIQGYIPLLGIDVWEHAYYPQYKNVRADYVKNIWSVVNWANVEERFINANS